MINATIKKLSQNEKESLAETGLTFDGVSF
jgi:hypothetical protein